MALQAGRLRHKVQLQEPQTTQDPNTGEMVVTWVAMAEPWRAVEPTSVRALYAAQAAHSEVKGQIVIRKRSENNATMRFVLRGKSYHIRGLLDDKESGLEYSTCPVSEGVRVV